MSVADFKNRQHARRLATCVHFNGLMNDACKVGVPYKTVRDESARPYTLPCITLGRHEACANECVKRQMPTDEEVAAEEARINAAISNVAIARAAIVGKIGQWRRGMPGADGTLQCPICKTGTLVFSRAAMNGHIHAACTTDGCARWME